VSFNGSDSSIGFRYVTYYVSVCGIFCSFSSCKELGYRLTARVDKARDRE